MEFENEWPGTDIPERSNDLSVQWELGPCQRQ